jgi:lysophospholipase L1-like esterase
MNIPASDPTSKHLSWKGKAALLLIGFFLTAGLLELGLRISAAVQARARHENSAAQEEYWAIYDQDLGYRQNPKFQDLNSDGLREHPIGPKGNRHRLLFLGDSIAFYGDTIDDTFVGHLRSTLHQNSANSRVDVIDAGIKGYTNYQEILYLKKYGLKFQPDVVGVQFCLNDLFKFLHSFEIENGRLVPGTYHFSSEAVGRTPGLLRRLAMKSYLLVWLRENLPVATKVVEWQARGGFSFEYTVDFHTAWQDKPWEDINLQLAELVELGRQHQFKPFFVVIPLAVQYRPDYLARNREYVLKPQRKLKEICDRLKIPFYDPYPDMDAGMFLGDGLHLNAVGRRVVGEQIALFLNQSGLLMDSTPPPPLAQSSSNR